mmetsp:Transcript_18545/g.41773  ORF Transcript_18545/g.41773 Transcript_18545/m.41773 type:complete len:362 (-) Transcript_18545:85-1170(-)
MSRGLTGLRSLPKSAEVQTSQVQMMSEEVQTAPSGWVSAEVQTEQRLAVLADAAVQTEACGVWGASEGQASRPAGDNRDEQLSQVVQEAQPGDAHALLEELGLPSSDSETSEDEAAGEGPTERGGTSPGRPEEPVRSLEGCLEGAATSFSEVRSALDKLGNSVEEVASRVASRAESLISEVQESIRQEEGQYERRWWQNFAEVVTGEDEASGERCADTGSSYDLRAPAAERPGQRDMPMLPSDSEADSMEDLDFGDPSTPDSDLGALYFARGGDTGGAGSPQVPVLAPPLKLPSFQARQPPPRPLCLPPATPSQRARASSEPSDTDSTVQSDGWLGPGRGNPGPVMSLRPLPPGPLAFRRR